MAIGPYNCELDIDTKTLLKIHLFRNVKNVDMIRSKIVEGSWQCAAVKAELVVDPLQVAVAANAAVLARMHDTMSTRTVYGEILYNLSLTKNISQSLSRFGINKEKDLLVCFLITYEGEDASKDVISQIDGDMCPMSELSALTNLKEVKRVYKVNNSNIGNDGLLDIIISKMATKNIVSY